MTYKIPKVVTLNPLQYTCVKPSKISLVVNIEPKYIDDNIEKILYYKCKLFERRVVPPGVYIYKIDSIHSYSNGCVYTTDFTGNLIYKVIVNVWIFNPSIGDILVGCNIKRLQDGNIYCNYIDNSVIVNILNVGPMTRYVKDATINVQIKEFKFMLDKPKYAIIDTNFNQKRPHKTFAYKKMADGGVEFLDLNNVKVVKLEKYKIKVLEQMIIIGSVMNMWDIPFRLRYIKWSHKNRYPIGKISLDMVDYTKISPPMDHNKLSSIQRHFINNPMWESFLKFIINPYELLLPSKRYKHKIMSPIVEKTIQYTLKKYSNGLTPISRAYYKLYEIIKVFQKYIPKRLGMCITLGDAPGGWAQCLNLIHKNKIISVSLTDKAQLALGMKKENLIVYDKWIVKNKDITIDNLHDGKGDLLNIDNIKYIIAKYRGRISLIGGDAAISYAEDQQKGISKEVPHIKITMVQLVIGLGTLTKGGFITVKIYNRKTLATKQLFYMISRHFEHMFIYKPESSRISNTESFVIFSGFNGISSVQLNSYVALLNAVLTRKGYVRSFFNYTMNEQYLKLYKYHNLVFNDIRLYTHLLALELSQYNPKSMKYNMVEEQINKCKDYFAINAIDKNE